MKHLGRALSRKLAHRGDAPTPDRGAGRATKRPGPKGGRGEGDPLVRAIRHGTPLDEALVQRTRGLLRSGEVHAAQSFAESLRANPDTEPVGRLLCGIVAYHRGFLPLAWHRLEGVPRATWARHAAREYTRAGLRVAPDDALREIGALVDEGAPELTADAWFAIIGPVLAVGRTDLARRLLAPLERLAEDDDPDEESSLRRRIDGIRPWVSAEPGSTVGPRRETLGFAVLDYKRPGTLEGSQNIGDHIQSIAALGHLVRHANVPFQGEPELVELLSHMRDRTRPELQLRDRDAPVEVITVQRDASELEVVPEGTWTLCFGWYMHPIFGFRHGFPLNPALRPVFVSFHCNERALLTEPAVEYLKKYGPVGCRDWTTVHLLLSMGVPAFFSGCLTTTISTVFPDRPGESAPAGTVAYVDARGDIPPDADRYGHADPEVRSRTFAANCLVALERLETYRRRYARVVTSRLHCYLPLRSLGVPVDFHPDNRSDIRFNGLMSITDDQFDAMRGGLLDKLEQVFNAILAGKDEDSVYALWRDITAPDVEAAQAHAAAGPDPVEDPAVLHRNLAEAASGTRVLTTAPGDTDDAVHCAVELQKGDAPRLRALVASLTRHTSRAVHLHVLSEGARPRLEEELVRDYPQHTFSWVDVGGIDRDLRDVTGKPPRQLARLCLPELLPDVPRLVLLPVGSVVTRDLTELADLDLAGHPVAAPTAEGRQDSGFGLLHKAAARLGDRTELAATLLRNAYAKHAFDFDAFSTEVMVLDLERMRSEGFVARAGGLSLASGMNAREVLHHMVGPDRAHVPESWAHVPTHSPDVDAGLVHWVGETKPWDDSFTPLQETWHQYAAAPE